MFPTQSTSLLYDIDNLYELKKETASPPACRYIFLKENFKTPLNPRLSRNYELLNEVIHLGKKGQRKEAAVFLSYAKVNETSNSQNAKRSKRFFLIIQQAAA